MKMLRITRKNYRRCKHYDRISRKANFKNDNVDDVLVVTDCKQKPVEDKLQEELPPGQKLMRQMEAKSGVDVHVVIDEDSYDDGFEEATADERKE